MMQIDQMKRRVFITLLGGAAAWPLPVRAQQRAKVAHIGYLGLVSASWHTPRVTAFRAGLRDLGYAEGKNIVIEFRWAEGRYDQLPALAAELVRLDVDVIVTHTVTGAIAAKQATSTIPIVITAASDLLAFGLVESLARPGGNLTGLSFFNAELVAKRLELLKELAPSLAKAAVLLNADNPAGNQLILRELEPTAKALKVELLTFEARGPGDFEGVFAAMVSQQIGADCPPRRSDAECKHQGDCGYFGQAPAANMRLPGIRGSRRLDGLWDKLTRDGSARRCLHRQDSQGCEASGPSSRARDEVHDDRQSKDGPGHGHRHAHIDPAARRRGNRMSMQPLTSFAAAQASVPGTKRRRPRRRIYVSFWGSSGIAWTDGLGCLRRE
jgi:hypothetical protein